MMMLTIWEGIVPLANTTILMESYKDFLTNLPSGVLSTYLLEDVSDPTKWQLIAVWESKESLEKVQRTETTFALNVFRAAGSEPVLSVFNISMSKLQTLPWAS